MNKNYLLKWNHLMKCYLSVCKIKKIKKGLFIYNRLFYFFYFNYSLPPNPAKPSTLSGLLEKSFNSNVNN